MYWLVLLFVDYLCGFEKLLLKALTETDGFPMNWQEVQGAKEKQARGDISCSLAACLSQQQQLPPTRAFSTQLDFSRESGGRVFLAPPSRPQRRHVPFTSMVFGTWEVKASCEYHSQNKSNNGLNVNELLRIHNISSFIHILGFCFNSLYLFTKSHLDEWSPISIFWSGRKLVTSWGQHTSCVWWPLWWSWGPARPHPILLKT